MTEEESGESSAGSINPDESDVHNLDFKKWLAALEENLRITAAFHFELKSKQIGVKEAAEIWKLLLNSQVVDLNISCNKNLQDGVEDLAQFLETSGIKKLSFCRCLVGDLEFLRMIGALKNTHVSEIIVNYEKCTHFRHNCFEFDSEEEAKFMSYMRGSCFTRLECQGPSITTSLLQVIQDTSITHLNISGTTIPEEDLSLLFSTLQHTAITDLKLYKVEISEDGLKQLSCNLSASNLVSLTLSHIGLCDAQLDILADGLPHSKISSLDISGNCVTGSNSFGHCLTDSPISDLSLSYNPISSWKLLSFPRYMRHSSIVKLNISHCVMVNQLCELLMESLKFSKVTHLNLSHNQVDSLSTIKLATILEDTALISVDFSNDRLSPKGLEVLGNCLKSSKLKSIGLGNRLAQDEAFFSQIATFLVKTTNTSVETVDLSSSSFGCEGLRHIAACLANTTFTRLNLCHVEIGDSIVDLARQLKLTAITHLDLSNCQLYNANVETLARYIPETQIMSLILSHNHISDFGATVLARCLKDSKLVHLNLAGNEIGDEGFESLAKHAKGTFLLTLDVSGNYGKRDLLIERVLLENETSAHFFVTAFKFISRQPENSFCFDDILDECMVAQLFKVCFLLYTKVVELPSAVSVLVAEDSLSLSMEQSVRLLEEEFPRQFTAFVASRIEASPEQHVSILKRAEELRLTKIVELLLLNRPAFMVDQSKAIMHPYVYQLLHKYNQPLYSSVEPEGKTKIIEYYSEHSDVDGASDVINILSKFEVASDWKNHEKSGSV